MVETRFEPEPDPSRWPADLPPLVEADAGRHVRFTTSYGPDWRHGPWSMGEVRRRPAEGLALLAGLRDAAFEWDRALFLDLEAGAHPRGGPCVWLAGSARFDGGALRLEQRLARDDEGEGELLAALAEACAGAGALVTFSGKSFDVPMLRARAAAWRIEPRLPPLHLDLYRMAGKLLRKRSRGADAPRDQKLVTCERELLRFERGEDLAGGALPCAWQELLAGGPRATLYAALRHNLLDVLALPALAAELSFRVESPQEEAEREQLAELQVERARDRAALEAALELDPDSFRARLELSKAIEREEGDLTAALRHAEAALEVAPAHLADAARRRIAQLTRRLARGGPDPA